MGLSARSAPNPWGWPDEVAAVLDRSITAEFASLTRSGRPVTFPTTPFVGADGLTLDVSTGLTYPAKAERARRNPRVALLYADPVGAGIDRPPVVLVQGLATVRDADLQANTDRYLRASATKLSAATRAPRFVLKRLGWYYARIWIEVTPLHLRWWPSRALEERARTWDAPEGTAAPLSDPPPSGKQPGAWVPAPRSWRAVAEAAAARLSMHDLSVLDHNGFPLCLPVQRSDLGHDGFTLHLGPGAPALHPGPACLTLQVHPEPFTGQENRTFVGTVAGTEGEKAATVHFRVERALGHWSLAGGRARMGLGFVAKGRHLRPRLAAEARRRFQPVPVVRFPDEP